MDLTVHPAASRPTGRWRAIAPVLTIAALVFVADQLSKLWIVAAIGRAQPRHEIVVIPGWFVFQYVENTGAAFGMFTNAGWVLAALAIGVVALIIVMAPRIQQEARTGFGRWQLLLSLGLVLGGAVGNLLDRILRGYVVDFILVPVAQITLGSTTYHFPNFNVADSGITVGIIVLLLSMLFAPDSERTVRPATREQ